MTSTSDDTPPDEGTMTLQPFDFWPASASRIIGLGGTKIDADPAYVFHSAYLELGPGDVECSLEFSGLESQFGTLTLRVNELAANQTRAETVRTRSLSLNEIQASGGVTKLTFPTAPGARYAVLGHSYGDLDARADGLTVTARMINRSRYFEDKLIAAQKSAFGSRVFRRATQMFAGGRTTLADPVSQACTAEQFDEPVYAEMLERLKAPLHRHRKQWEFVYILRVLERYGMLRPGARGLGFGVGVEPLPAVMAACGCEVVATDLPDDDARALVWRATQQHSTALQMLHRPEICANEIVDAAVTLRSVDMNDIPPDLRNFDFCWSSCALEHLGSIEAGLDFIRNSVNCLNHGGLAVHTTELNLTSNKDTIDNDSTVLFRRRDIERLAVDLVSRGYFVAQLKFDAGRGPLNEHVDVPPYSDNNHLKLALGNYVTTSFGIIVRRGDR